MKLRYILPLLFCLYLSDASAQGSSGWQQRVDYQMDVHLYADRHQLDGHQILRYHNNSPDTLRRVYYHLYFNAFNPHSMMAERNRHLPDPDGRIVPRIFELGPDEVGYQEIRSLTQNGEPVDFRIDDTVMEVELAEPILPGEVAVFEMDFHAQVPLQTRRSGRDNREGIDYSMSQWYPKLANYDERGWHADPYVGREFYAPFGTFDVRITIPSEYTIASTGMLQNPEEIGHGYTEDSVAVDTDSLTWHFRAEDVHDFAWAADPDYRHDVIPMEDGPTIHLFYQPDVAEVWQTLHEDGPAIVDFFSRTFGEYPYPQITAAQAGDGGMEYPMITFVTGRRSPRSLQGVTAHEWAHMWFYGVLASNEADYAWMDEGFTSYATTEVTGRLQGDPDPAHMGAFMSVLLAHHYNFYEPLNTPSDWFRTNTAYGVSAYSGGEMLVEMLGYVMSDSLHTRFFHEYFDRFSFRHPNPYDVETVAEDVSGLRLDWFFEQFGDTDWTMDYAVDRIHQEPRGPEWDVAIELERRSDIVMPIDLRLTLEDGSEQWITIPLSIMQGHKPVPDSWIVAEPWQWTYPGYTLRITTPSRVVHAEIDPRLRTPDTNRLNNVDGFPVDFSLLRAPNQSWSRYQVGWRPLGQYASQWGVGLGLQFRGTYLFNRLESRAMVKLWPQILTSDGADPDIDDSFGDASDDQLSALDGIAFSLQFSTPTRLFGRYGRFLLQSRRHLGILENRVELLTNLARFGILSDVAHNVSLEFTHQAQTTPRAEATEVASGFQPPTMLSGGLRYSRISDAARITVGFEAGGSFNEDFDFGTGNRAFIDGALARPAGNLTGVVRALAGTGAGNLALQNRFRLGAASFEDRWANDAYRSVGAVFDDPLHDAHWVAFGGPGPVAYMRRTFEALDEEQSIGAPSGVHVLAASARLVTDGIGRHPLLAPLRLEAFVGAGDVWNGRSYFDELDLSELLLDAGFGIHLDVSEIAALRRWTAQSDVLSNLQLTARFPIWASEPEVAGDEQQLAFRWLIGVTVDDVLWN